MPDMFGARDELDQRGQWAIQAQVLGCIKGYYL